MSPASYRAAPPRVVVPLNYTAASSHGQISIGSVLGGAPESLDLTARLLGLDPAVTGCATRSCGTSLLRRRCHRLPEGFGQAQGCRATVLPLRAALGCRDREATVVESGAEPASGALPEGLRDVRTVRQVERHLDTGVCGVDALTPGPTSATEPPQQLVGGDDDAGAHLQVVVHDSSMDCGAGAGEEGPFEGRARCAGQGPRRSSDFRHWASGAAHATSPAR